MSRRRRMQEHAMRIDRIDHLVLTVADVDTTIRWYEEVLGMKHERFGDGRSALRFGQQRINLHPSEGEIQPRATKPTEGSADICLVLDGSVEEAITHLNSLEVPLLLGPVMRTGATGPLTSLYVRDPDGNLIELSTYSESSR